MTNIKQTILWTSLLFISLTFLTMKDQTASDGLNAYGFPLTFYSEFTGKCDNCYGQFGFNFLYLLADIALTAIIVLLTLVLKKNFFNKNNL